MDCVPAQVVTGAYRTRRDLIPPGSQASLSRLLDHHHGVNDIRHFCHAQQSPCFVRLGPGKRNDHAPGQEAPELGLSGGTG
jgi:hypothetical protein